MSRMTRGERRLAQRLEEKLAAEYLFRHDVPSLVKPPCLREEAYAIADQLSDAHKEGHA